MLIPDTERRNEAGPVPAAGAEELSDLGIEEDEARHVPLFGRPPLEATEQRRCGRVPRQQIEPRTDDEGRQRLDGGEQTEQARANILERVEILCRSPPGESEEMRSLEDVELEGAGKSDEDGVGGRDPA